MGDFSFISYGESVMLRQQGLNSASEYQLYLEESGDYGTATVVSEEDFRKVINDTDSILVWRGMPDSEYSTGDQKLDNVMYGEKYYTGSGIYGDGLYFANTPEVAGRYATRHALPGSHGAVVRAAVKPDAKVGDYFNVAAEMAAEYPNITLRSDGLISAYARSRGYDIITSDHGNGNIYYTVLNRGSLVMCSELMDARTSASKEIEITFRS